MQNPRRRKLEDRVQNQTFSKYFYGFGKKTYHHEIPLTSSEQLTHALDSQFRIINLDFSPIFVFNTLKKIIFSLIGLHIIVRLIQMNCPDFLGRDLVISLFDLDGESNIPASYSTLTLLVSSLILGFIANLKKSANDRYSSYWYLLSFVFLLFGLDELISLHERMSEPTRMFLQPLGMGGLLPKGFYWVVPAVPMVLVFLISLLKFIKRLPRKTRLLFVLSGFLYVSGAIGCETIGGYFHSIHGPLSFSYLAAMTLEETLEMLGVATFIYALLFYISTEMGGIKFSASINCSDD